MKATKDTEQLQATVPVSVRERIEQIAAMNHRSLSSMTLVLLLEALKLREGRKR
jgi:hypothetical protein